MRESDIRPTELFAEYCRLSAIDAQNLFDQSSFDDCNCPGCGEETKIFAFEKQGFSYHNCPVCNTLYVSPRPAPKDLERLYSNSTSTKYWAEVFLPAVLEARREKIFRPRVERVKRRAHELDLDVASVIDVGSGHGVFLEEWRAHVPGSRITAIEAGKILSGVIREKGFDVIEAFVEDVPTGKHELAYFGDIVTCFEVIEHIHDTFRFASALHHVTAPGGTALVTGLGRDGFDIRVLGPLSRSIAPPHHLNFLSVEGCKKLFRRAGFTEVVVESPGKLDVDIVYQALRDPSTAEDVESRLSEFETAVLNADENTRQAFQSFLAQNRMSSHLWVWARR